MAVSVALAASGCGPAFVPGPEGPLPQTISRDLWPRTRAERSNYTETSRYADVVAFIDSLQKLGGPIAVGSIGKTTQGRDIPYVIASRPLVRTPDEARRLGRPVVYIQGNIHAGEVEGKEALQALVRDIVLEQRRNVLDSIVFIAVPIYNADGNEAVGPQERNRADQNGPQLVGGRASAMELNLNRDYIKAEAPETSASLAMFAAWDPDVFADLHTTNGSYHGYALTYSPPLTPGAPLGAYTQGVWLPVLRRRMHDRHRFETFDYGNFLTDNRDYAAPTPATEGWATFDHRPRYSTNYYGLRNGVAILSEGYSHDPFARRVASTYAFVREILSLAAEKGGEVERLRAAARDGSNWRIFPVRSRLTRTPLIADVVTEDVESTGDSSVTEPGVARGRRRTGRFRTVRMPVFDRFDPVYTVSVPSAYVIRGDYRRVEALLRLHGIQSARITASRTLAVEEFVVDSIHRAPRAFEEHHEVRITGKWMARRVTAPRGSLLVATGQPLGRLAVYLLEPESDDGLVAWNYFDEALTTGAAFPVLRVR